jgi:hypothetical protein
MYNELKQQISSQGNSNFTVSNGLPDNPVFLSILPQGCKITKDNSVLQKWMAVQRQEYHEGTLSQYRIDLLRSIDFDFECISPVSNNSRIDKSIINLAGVCKPSVSIFAISFITYGLECFLTYYYQS